MKKILTVWVALFCMSSLYAQGGAVSFVQANSQHAFPDRIPAGNYSGICRIDSNLYAVVSDKSAHEGFFVFRVGINPQNGDIEDVENLGFRGQQGRNRDQEGIVYLPETRSVLVSGEEDNRILEYDLNGNRTLREVTVPPIFHCARGNYGFESLSYNAHTQLLWTCTESTLTVDGEAANATNGVKNRIRIQSFDRDLRCVRQYAYEMDAPLSRQAASLYAMGISELTALDQGELLVLEREFYVPSSKLGAWVNHKIYVVRPQDTDTIAMDRPLSETSPFLKKRLLYEWKTTLSLFKHEIANYEGMCLGPRLADGRQVLLLVSDSQNQYAGVLKDWFKTILIQ